MSAYPTQAQFAEQIGTHFNASAGGERVELELTGVHAGIESEHYAPFSLEFFSAGDVQLPQATYSLEHGVLGTHDVFLVPIGRQGTRTRYEAVFNVAKESEG